MFLWVRPRPVQGDLALMVSNGFESTRPKLHSPPTNFAVPGTNVSFTYATS